MSKSGYVRLPARQHNPAQGHQFSLPTFSSRPAPPPKLDLVKQLVKRAIPLLLFSVVCIYFAIGKSGFVWDLTTPATVGTPRSPKHNQGWVTFDSRRHSPFLNRLHNTAPATQQERLFSEPCRDLWISRNELCPEIRKRQLKHAHRFDVVHSMFSASVLLILN